jgi:D-glycero-alpha-D-manno-heptose-7-phosphate kinase
MVIARAPLRIPLGGGGTDLRSYYSAYGGFFISAAIDKYVYVAINRPASDDLIRVKYSRSEEVMIPDELQHDLVREALKTIEITQNLEIASMADVSAGTGMGSSGSYLVALLMALHALKKDHQPRWALAEEACHIEIDLAGHPVGKQDQYAAVFGGINCYEVDTEGAVTVTPLRVPVFAQEDLQRCLLLFYTGKTRPSDLILAQQKADTERGDSVIVESLHRTKELGYEIKGALEAGDLVKFGALLDRHWGNKKERSRDITNSRVDCVYAKALENGALGGKILGAGGGGFLLLLASQDATRRIREIVSAEGFRHMAFTFDHEGSKVLLNM